MPNLKALTTAIVCASLLPLSAAFAQTMNKADYKTSKTRISADYKTDKAACKAQTGNAKDICQEEAKAKEKSPWPNCNTATQAKPLTATKSLW